MASRVRSRFGRQSVRPVPLLERRQVELELQLARQQVRRAEPLRFPRQSLHVSLGSFPGEFCFVSCPCQPPSIFPIPSIWKDRVIYFLLLSDFASHRTSRSIFRVSSLRMANRTCGSLSERLVKLATAIDSMQSTNRPSMRTPSVYRCIFGTSV